MNTMQSQTPMIKTIQLLKNVGVFDNFTPSDEKPQLSKLTLIYADNGRGKTTLSSILDSLGTNNNPDRIKDRYRLQENNKEPTHIVIKDSNNKDYVYQNKKWNDHIPEIVVFNDDFVNENVYSGIEVTSEHQKKLHDIIISREGVNLKKDYDSAIEQDNANQTELKKAEAILQSISKDLSVDQFCALPKQEDIDSKIETAEKTLKAAKSADLIQKQNVFEPKNLPAFDLPSIRSLLSKSLDDLQQDAANQVQQHLEKIGGDAENWLRQGQKFTKDNKCPFCDQNLSGSHLIKHYQAYFSHSYKKLHTTIKEKIKELKNQHGEKAQTQFVTSVTNIEKTATFWQQYTDIPPSESIDTMQIVNAWRNARDSLLGILNTKAGAPLARIELTQEIEDAHDAYEQYRKEVEALNQSLIKYNSEIEQVKQKSKTTDSAKCEKELALLKLTRQRCELETDQKCQSYLAAKSAKDNSAATRTAAKQELDTKRGQIFQKYFDDINKYLEKLLADFRLEEGKSDNRGGGKVNYDICINEQSVNSTAKEGASFKNTLSAGDRNTLALAFFFALLKQDSAQSNPIVVFDDPISSLDEHRSNATIDHIFAIKGVFSQIILLSHSKKFLIDVWKVWKKRTKHKDNQQPTTIQINRLNTPPKETSKLEHWDIEKDCQSDFAKKRQIIKDYINEENPEKAEQVAGALRPCLELFINFVYPENSYGQEPLKTFIGNCHQGLKNGKEILNQADLNELIALKNYATGYNHAPNDGAKDKELLGYCKKVLEFTRRPTETEIKVTAPLPSSSSQSNQGQTEHSKSNLLTGDANP